jgi:hypothetical protein
MASIWFLHRKGFPGQLGISALLSLIVLTPLSGFSQGSDLGFETPVVGTSYQYNPGGAPWTFAGNSGITGNASGFTGSNPNAPEGSQVAFVQTTGSMSQPMPFASSFYKLVFSAAQRNFGSAWQTFNVTLDGVVLTNMAPAQGATSYQDYTVGPFPVTAGTHTLAFVGTDLNGGDNTIFIDNLRFTQMALSAAISPASFTTNHPFSVTITSWPTTATTYYRLNGGAWLTYTNPFTIGDGQNAATVQVDSYATDGVSFSPTNSATYVYQPPAVVNDFFVDRISLTPPPIVYPDTVNGTTFQHPGFWTNFNVTLTGATMENNEPNHANSSPAASVWYTYTTASSGEMRLVVPTNYPSVIAVYTGGSDTSYFPFEGSAVNALNANFNFSINGAGATFIPDAAPIPGSAQSLNLNGTGSYVQLVDANLNSFTCSLWVKVRTVQLGAVIYRTSSSGPQSSCSESISIDSNGRWSAWGGSAITSSVLVQPNTWYHLAISGANNGAMHFYVNGVEQGAAISNIGSISGRDRWQMGQAVAGGGQAFNGEIDDLAIYHKALSGSQVAALATGTAPPAYAAYDVSLLSGVASSTSGTLSFNALGNTVYQIAFAAPGHAIYDFPADFFFFPPPANDNFTNAAAIPNTLNTTNLAVGNGSVPVPYINYAVQGYTEQATAETGETENAKLSVWYSFLAPASGWLSVNAANASGIYSYLEIGQGTLSNFTNTTRSGWSVNPGITLRVIGGQQYYIRHFSDSANNWTPFTLALVHYPQPANDLFANPAPLTLNSQSLHYVFNNGVAMDYPVLSSVMDINDFAATRESVGEPSFGNSVWYNYTPSQNGRMVVGLADYGDWGTYNGYEMGIYTGTAANLLTPLFNSQAYSWNALLNGWLTAGTNYLERIATYDSGHFLSVFEVTNTFFPNPANDNFTNRQPIATRFVTNSMTWKGQQLFLSVDEVANVPGFNFSATTESGEPVQGGTYNSIWYSWTPTRNEYVTFNTVNSYQYLSPGATIDTYLAAYTGSAINALTTVTGNDNGPSMGNWSQIGFTPALGTEYKIQISNYGNGSAGWTMLNFQQAFRPANDYFTNATPVTLTKSVLGDSSTFEYFLFYGTITNASVETSEPNNGGVSTVWYNWTNDITGPVTIRMDSSFGGNFYVYTGNAVTSLSTIASPVGGLDGKIYCTFNGVAANAYRIQVRCGTGGGAFSLEFSQKTNPGNYVTTNDNQTNTFQILPDSIDSNNRYVGSANGSATNATLEPGETNALSALISSGAELNDNYNTNVVGSNSLWWSYTATATRKMATYNQALVACVPMRMGLGYDAFMNLVKPSNPFNENQYLVATTNGAYFTNANSATWFASRPAPGAPFRFEMDYLYVANAGAANGLPSTYNIIVMGNNGYYDPLVIRTTDLMLGAYNNGTFTPYNIALTPNQEYYLSLECNGGGAATAYTLTLNRTNSSTIYAGIDANSYCPMGLGACGGRVHDLRVYQTSPVSHEAIEVWQGGNLIAIDDDVVVNNCTAGLTYQIRTTPLSCTTDVAAGKIATESSIVNPAANAVDNNNSTYSSTGNDTGAWLMVDLGQSYPINSVEVWNRFDQPSAAYFNVIISDTNSSNPAILTNYAINCGGGAVGWFGADAYASGGSTWSCGNAIDTSAVTNPAPMSVYQSQRYGNFTYTIPNLLTNGSYTVRLHFAECSCTGPNQRQANVVINGRQVLTNFDVFAAAGAGNKANIQSFTVTPNNSGQITIQFISIVANAAVEGIEVIPTSDTAAAFQASQTANGLYYYPYPGSAQWPTTIPIGRSGRYVRVQQTMVGSSLGLSSLKVNSTPTINGQVNISVSEFNLSADGNSPEAAKLLPFANQVTTWALPNGAVSATNYVAADSQEVAYATWYSGEWNPGGVGGGSIWYNFVPPVSGSTIIASSGTVGEYLALYPGPNTSGNITYGWGPFQLNVNGGTPYWLQVGLASYGLEGVTLTIVSPPPNDNWANAINVNFVTNALVTSSPDGPVTNYTCTASFVGQNYLASRDAGEYNIANYTGVATTGRSVWWTITAPANGYITIDPTKSSFLTELGLRPESVGVGSSYGGYWVVNNGKIVNAYLSAGTRYKLCVDGSSQDTGPGMGGINLDITFVPCPSNDNWASPTPVTLQTNVLTGTVPDGVALYTNYTGSVASHNIGATYEGGEYPINNYSSQGAPGRSVWFSFTAPASGYLKIDPTKSAFRAQIGIKAPGQAVSSSWGGPNAYAVNSALTYYVNAGATYMICVDGTSSDAGYGIINLDFKLDASPGNDYWANPTPIIFQTNIATISMPNGTATNNYYTACGIGNSIAATYEGGEYPINNYSSQGAPGRSVWFTFTAPYTGTLTIDPTKSTFRTQIGIKAPGQAVNSSWGGPNTYAVNSILSYGVTAGNTYMLCVDGTSSDAGYGFIDLALQINAIPYNDIFPGPMLAFATNTVLETIAEFTVTNLLYTASAVSANNYALQDSGEYSLCSQFSAPCLGRTIWWSFNPPVQSYATISLAGSTFDTLLAGGVFNGVNNGKSWYNDDANGLVTSAATVLVYPGQTNRIVVDGKSGAASGSVGGVNLTVTLGAPTNDFYANAQVLTPQSVLSAGNMTGIGIRVPGSTTYASNEGENWAGNSWLTVPPNKNVWFSYATTNSGTIYLTVESAGNHLVAVYSGSSFNSGWIGGSVGVQGAAPNAACTFTATAGTTYKICVDGTVPGPFVLNLKHYGTAAPVNDNFVNRIPLTNGVMTSGTLAGSTRESGEPSYHGGNGSVWYSFVAVCTGQLEVDTLGSAGDTIIAAYTTNTVPAQVNNLTYLTANNDADGKTSSRISVPVTAGREYEIAVALNSGTLQNFVITPRLTCSGYVEADPGTGNFLEYGTVFLTTPGGGSIYYSLNGGAYQLYTNGPTITSTNLVYVGVTNGIFTKTGGGNNWNAGFTSGETIAGDGFAECVATVINQDSMFGLQATYSSASYTGIDYAFNLSGSGQLQIFEAGTYKATGGYYNGGDRLRIVRTGNIVRYYRNGGLVCTSSVTSAGPLHFVASMYQQGTCTLGPCYLRNAGLANETGVVISSGDVNGTATLSAYSQAGSVNSWNYTVQAAPAMVLKGNYLTWTNLSGVYQAGTLLTKYSANNAWGNALGVSVDSSSGDCSADFVVSPGSSYNMAGLTANNTISGYGDLNFAWHNANGVLYIYESGTYRGCFGPTVPGDVLRVERLASTINYYQNGNLRYTSSLSSSGTLRAATTIYWTATQLGPASFYLPQSPAVTIVPSPYGDSTLYTSTAPPTAAPTVTSSSPDAFAQPPSLASSANFRFRNFRTGIIPSTDVLLSYLVNSLPGLVFQVPGPVIYTPNPITVVSPSGVGGTWTITFPNGSKSTGSGSSSYTFSPQGGGSYAATLYAPGYNIPSASTNLSFVVNDLGITPSGTYGAIPFYVNAWGTYPLSIYYTFTAQGTPNILYTNPIVLGNTNVTIRFMGTRPGFTPQYLTGAYAYSPNVIISPTGTFSNATAFTVSGGNGLQYQVGSGPWQAYPGPFTLDGIPGGSDFLRGCAQVSPGVYGPTNSTRVSFQADYPTVTQASGTVNGTYSVAAQSDTIGAAVYYAMGDAMGSMPALASVTNLYTGPISLSGSCKFLFIARKVNYLDSAPVTNAYTAQLPPPAFVTPGAAFSGPAQITVQSADNYGGTFVLESPSGAVQTVNTTNSTASFTINEGGQFTLLLQRNGWTPSPPVTQSYNFVFSDLSIGPASTCLYAPTIISINWDGTNPKTPTVYYTLDGSAPTTNSTRYTGAFTLTNSATITALGIRAGYTSTCVSNNYIYEFSVTAWPPSGTYNNALSLSLSNSQALAIYYQVSGGEWQTYTGPFSLDGTGSGNVGLSTRYDTAAPCPGPTNLCSYSFKAADPIITPAGTNFNGSLTLSAADSTAGAAIFYAVGDTNGNSPSASAITNLYTGPITFASTRQFIFQARKNGYQDSGQVPQTYSCSLPAPGFGTPGGTFTNATAIALNSPLNTSQSFVLSFPDGTSQTDAVTGTTTSITINQTGDYQLQLFKSPWLPSLIVTNAYMFQCADLSVTPASMNFSFPMAVQAASGSNPKPITIFYASDGTLPTTNSALYTGAISVSNTITLRFLGTRLGYLPQYVDRQYNYAPGCTISPPTSTNSQAITVTITPVNGNSAIYFRLNGGAWTNYANPFTLDGYAGGSALMEVYTVTGPYASATNQTTYTFQVAPLSVNPPTGDPTGGISVTAGTATPAVSLYYGCSYSGDIPGDSSLTNLYTGPVALTNTAVLLFEGRKNGYLSTRSTNIYSGKLPLPAFLTPSATFTNQTTVAVQSGLAGISSGWTMITPSGKTNTYASSTDTLQLGINESGVFQVKNTRQNWLDSDYAAQTYNFVVQDLVVSPPSGDFGSNLTVTAQSSISNPNPLKIYYTTDNTVPTTNSTLYSGSIVISNDTTFNWLATRWGYAHQYATNAYRYVPPLVFQPGAGTYSNAITASLSTTAAGAAIFYSLDGTNWGNYTSPFVLDGLNNGTGTLQAYYTNGTCGSTGACAFAFVCAPLTVNPASLTLSGPISVTASTVTTNTTIQYSFNNSAIETLNLTNVYAEPISVSNRSFLAFQGSKPGYQSTAPVQRKYIEKLPPPVFLTPSGAFSNQTPISLEVSRVAPGLSLTLTGPDGTFTASAPVAASGRPSATFNLNGTGAYQASATGPDWASSDPATNSYSFVVQDLVTTPSQLFNQTNFAVAAVSSLGPANPKPLTIYYTIDGSTPTPSSTLYVAPLTLSNTTTITWLAARNGYTPQYASNTYTYVPPVMVSPPPGWYNNAIDVALTSPDGQPVTYTLDGASWLTWTGPVHLDGFGSGTMTLAATYPGGANSAFVYTFKALPPSVNPESQTLTGPVSVTAATGGTAGSTLIYFQGDQGGGIATTNLPAQVYVAPLPVNASRSFIFQCVKNGYLASDVVNRIFTGKLPAPTVLTAAQTFTNQAMVQVQSGLAGYGGAYLMLGPDGVTNRINNDSPLASFAVNASGTYQFWMQRAGWLDSDPSNWNASFAVTDLTVAPASGLLSAPTQVTATGGANPKPLKIYCTQDGSTPTTNLPVFTSLLVTNDTVLNWLATREGYTPEYATNSYVYSAGAILSPSGLAYSNAQVFTLTPYEPAGAVYYRLNYGDWTTYAQPITIDGNATLQYYVHNKGNSLTNTFSPQFFIAPLAITPGSQPVDSPINISAWTATAGASFYYAVGDQDGNGPDPGTVTNRYNGALTVSPAYSSTYQFAATKPGYASANTLQTYTAKLLPPASALGNHVLIAGPTVNTISHDRGGFIWGTFNGGNPHAARGTVLQETYTLAGTYSYHVSRPGWNDSDPIQVNVSYRQPDNFADRIQLQLITAGANYDNGRAPDLYGAVGDISGATAEPGEWDGTYNDGGSVSTDPGRATSLWYTWTAPSNGLAFISARDLSSGDTNYFVYGVYTGTTVSNLATVALAHSPSTVAVQASQTYQIAIYNGLTPGLEHQFGLNLQFCPEPANDRPATALALSWARTYSAYTCGAQADTVTSDPTPGTWWKFSTVRPGVLEIPLSAGTATCWTGTPQSLTQASLQYWTPNDYRWPESRTNNYFFSITSPGDYYVKITGTNWDYRFTPLYNLAPVNDNFPNTIAIAPQLTRLNNYTYGSFPVYGTTLGATTQAGEPAGNLGPATVWYQVTAPGDGQMDFATAKAYLDASWGGTSAAWDDNALRVQAYSGNTIGQDLVEMPDSLDRTPMTVVNDPTRITNTTPASAQVLTGANIAVTALCRAVDPANNSVWFTWKAPSGGVAAISLDPQPAEQVQFTVYQYTSSGGLQTIGGGGIQPNETSRFPIQQEQPYVIQATVWPGSGSSGQSWNTNFTFHLTVATKPHIQVSDGQLVYLRVSGIAMPHQLQSYFYGKALNDRFADAIQLALNPMRYDNGLKATINVQGSLAGAGAEPFETPGLRTVWYHFAAPINGLARVTMTGALNTKVRLFSGVDTNSLSEIGNLTFAVTNAGSYYLQISDTDPSFFQLSVTLAQVPSNDAFAQALPLSQNTLWGYTDFATTETGEPIHTNSVGGSVWWKYQPSQDGMIILSLNKELNVWQGTSLNNLVWLGDNTTNDVALPLQAGNTYYLAINDRLNTSPGDFQLMGNFWPRPANDDFVNATDIVNRQNSGFINGTIYAYSASGYNYGAGSQLNEPAGSTNSVWYRWTAPDNLLVWASCQQPFQLFTGESLNNLTLIDGKSFSARQGQVYHFAVGGGPGQFTLNLAALKPPSNDWRSQAITLTNGNLANFYTAGAGVDADDMPTTNNYSVWFQWDSGTSTNLTVTFGNLGIDIEYLFRASGGQQYPLDFRLYAPTGMVADACGGLSCAHWAVTPHTLYQMAILTGQPSVDQIWLSGSQDTRPGSAPNPAPLSWGPELPLLNVPNKVTIAPYTQPPVGGAVTVQVNGTEELQGLPKNMTLTLPGAGYYLLSQINDATNLTLIRVTKDAMTGANQAIALQPVGGDYVSSIDVDVNYNAYLGPIQLFYTTDATMPDSNAAPWAGPLHLTNTTTLKVAGYRNGEPPHYASATYTRWPALVETDNGNATNATDTLNITLASPEDGNTNILYQAGEGNWRPYTNGLTFDGGGASGVLTINYTQLENGHTNPIQQTTVLFVTPQPAVQPPSSRVDAPFAIQITPARASDQILYNLGDAAGRPAVTNFSAASVQSGATRIATNGIISLACASRDVLILARRPGYRDCAVIEARYTAKLPSPQVAITNANGILCAMIQAPVARGTLEIQRPGGASDYYTWNENNAWTDSKGVAQVYPLLYQLPAAGTYAVRQSSPDWDPSDFATITCSQPQVTLTYQGSNRVNVQAWPATMKVRYTLDGSAPTAQSPIATGPITIVPADSADYTTQTITASGFNGLSPVVTAALSIPQLPKPQCDGWNIIFPEAYFRDGTIVYAEITDASGATTRQFIYSDGTKYLLGRYRFLDGYYNPLDSSTFPIHQMALAHLSAGRLDRYQDTGTSIPWSPLAVKAGLNNLGILQVRLVSANVADYTTFADPSLILAAGATGLESTAVPGPNHSLLGVSLHFNSTSSSNFISSPTVSLRVPPGNDDYSVNVQLSLDQSVNPPQMQVAYTASLLVQTNGGTQGRYDCALGQCALTLPLASRNQTGWGQPLLTAYGFASVTPSGDPAHEITGPTRQFTVQQLPQPKGLQTAYVNGTNVLIVQLPEAADLPAGAGASMQVIIQTPSGAKLVLNNWDAIDSDSKVIAEAGSYTVWFSCAGYLDSARLTQSVALGAYGVVSKQDLTNGTWISIDCPANASACFTADGTPPTRQSSVYSGPFNLPNRGNGWATNQIRALIFAPGTTDYEADATLYQMPAVGRTLLTTNGSQWTLRGESAPGDALPYQAKLRIIAPDGEQILGELQTDITVPLPGTYQVQVVAPALPQYTESAVVTADTAGAGHWNYTGPP